MTELQTLTIDHYLPGSPSRVWAALTSPAELAQWWAPGDIRPVAGHAFVMQMPGWGEVPCTVIEAREPELLVYTFADWTLTWQLTAEGTGTRLVLEQSGFDMDNPQHRMAFTNMGGGWKSTVLPRLATLVALAA